MEYYFDEFGILSADPIPGRSTDVAPPDTALPPGHVWRWEGYNWAPFDPTPAVAPPAPPAPEWAWYIDHGPFADRLGMAATMTIDTSTEPSFVAIRADFARRKWIDLKDPRVAATVNYLAGQPLPVLGTLAQPLITAAEAQAILTTQPTAAENLALRKLYFSA